MNINIIKKIFKSKKKQKTLRQYSKILVTTLTIISVIWITWSYILATIGVIRYGNYDVLESLSSQVCITILGVSIGYFAKAFLETYSEKKQELENAKFESDQNIILGNQDINNTDEGDV